MPQKIKLAAILLAAGGSTRLGQCKQLLEYRGQPLVRRAARILTGIISEVIVVTGADAEQVARTLQDLPVKVQENPDWQDGMGSSIAQGVQALPETTDGVLLLLCDQYRIDKPDLVRLISHWFTASDHIVIARWGQLSGPPVILPRRFFPRLKKLSGDRGARHLVLEQSSLVQYVRLEHAGFDLDDANDLAEMRHFEAAFNPPETDPE